MKIPKINIIKGIWCLLKSWKAIGAIRDIFTLLSRLGAYFRELLWVRGHAQGAGNTMQLISPDREQNEANTNH